MAWRALTMPLHRVAFLLAVLIAVQTSRTVDANFLNEPFSTEQTCRSLQTKIHINREENDDFGNPLRTCEGSVEVTKCEGTCNSQVQPSLSAPHGFHKVRPLITTATTASCRRSQRQMSRRCCQSCHRNMNEHEPHDIVIYYCPQTNPFVLSTRYHERST